MGMETGNCKHRSNVDCVGGRCEKCGWNPEIETSRKNNLKTEKPTNLVQRLRAYKEKSATDALRVMASQIGGNVTADVLDCIAKGKTPTLEPGEIQRINKVLTRIEGGRDG